MIRAGLLALRRYDQETETYYTYYMHGKKEGYFHRMLKENFDQPTTIKTTKGELYEIRVKGNLNWINVGLGEFRLRLSAFNAVRLGRDLPPMSIVS